MVVNLTLYLAWEVIMSTDIARPVKGSIYIAFIPIVYFLVPNFGISGMQYVIYPVLVSLILFLLLFKTNASQLPLNSYVVRILVFEFIFIGLMTLSILANSGTIELSAITQLFKPVFFALIFYFSYVASRGKNILTIKRSLLTLAYVVLFAQMVVGLSQLFGLSVFDILYSEDKVRPLGESVRIAGTLGNPNIFAWVVTQMVAVVILFEPAKLKKWAVIALGLSLVFFSGSRSSLVLFPIILVVTHVLMSRKKAGFYFIKIPVYIVLLFLFSKFAIWFLYTYGQNFPYIYQLLSVIETGDLSSVNSFHLREMIWSNGIDKLNQGGVLAWLFGLGPGAITFLDNDYLYALTNYGLLYLVGHVVFYLFMIFIFTKVKDRTLKALGLQYIIFSMAVGYQADTLIGWTYPILAMIYVGIVVSINKSIENPVNELPRKRKRYRIVLR